MLTKHELVQVDTSYLLIWPGTPSLDHRKAFCGTNVVVTFVRGLQYLAETQKLEELQLKQSRQFIPVVPKALVSELVLLSHRGVILGTAVPFCGCIRPASHWSHLKRILWQPCSVWSVTDDTSVCGNTCRASFRERNRSQRWW